MDSAVLISFIGIILGVGLFIFLSFKGNNLAVSAALGALVVILFNGGNVVTDITEFWVTGLSKAVKSYFMIFVLGGIFGKVMDVGGGAKRISFSLLKLIRKSKSNPQFWAVYFLVIMYFIFTYVGIHGFIIVFTILPIGRELYHELNIPWRFYCYGSGGCIPAYYLLGSVSAVPSLAASLTGTHVGVAPLLSIAMVAVFFITHMLIIKWDVNRCIAKGEDFMKSGAEIWKLQMEMVQETDNLPKLYQALIPMLAMIVLAATGTPTMVALTVGVLLGIPFQWKNLKGKVKSTLNSGATSVFGALINVCGAAALGTVIINMSGYAFIGSVLDNVPPLIGGVFLAIFGTLLLGSSSSSMPAFGEQIVNYFNNAGLSSSTSFRLLTNAGNWVYPPHNTGVVNASSTAKVPYGEAVWIYIKSTAPANTVVSIMMLLLIQFGII